MTPLQSDIKLLMREPITLMLMLVPLILIGVFCFVIYIAIPFLTSTFSLLPGFYLPYLDMAIAIAISTMASLPGAAAGFMMLDERDARIFELMSITPLGRMGYLKHRLILVAVLCALYASLLKLLILGTVDPLTPIRAAMLGPIFALVLFYLAEDKVKGLTLSKAIDLVVLAPLIIYLPKKNILLTAIGYVLPTYWVFDQHIGESLTGLGVHGVWLTALLLLFYKRKQD